MWNISGPRPGIKPTLHSLEGEVLTTEPPGKSHYSISDGLTGYRIASRFNGYFPGNLWSGTSFLMDIIHFYSFLNCQVISFTFYSTGLTFFMNCRCSYRARFWLLSATLQALLQIFPPSLWTGFELSSKYLFNIKDFCLFVSMSPI